MHLIVNPAAAGGRVGQQWPRLRQRLAAAGLDLPISVTTAPGHASVLAADAVARGHEVVVAAGGDGTICEVLQGLHGTPCALAVLPLGTGNDAARTLRIPLRLEDAARTVLAGKRRRVDVMRAGDRVVLNAIGIGLLGAINVNAQSIKWVRGIGAYLAAAVGTLFRYRCPEIHLTNGHETYQGPMTILAIHNGVTTGGGFRLAPRALPDDGELDATLVAFTGVPARLSALSHAVRGTLGSKPFTRELRFTRLELLCTERLPYHWDGNPAHVEPPGMTFEVLPLAQEVVVPE
ncbi:MAG: diacylglycerol/lipid kinase family protein [Acidobacteriota bacterium]